MKLNLELWITLYIDTMRSDQSRYVKSNDKKRNEKSRRKSGEKEEIVYDDGTVVDKTAQRSFSINIVIVCVCCCIVNWFNYVADLFEHPLRHTAYSWLHCIKNLADFMQSSCNENIYHN